MAEALRTDLYQLTMAQAYLESGKNDRATFDLFVRKLPANFGYLVACGVEEATSYLLGLSFKDEDIDHLKRKKVFKNDFLDSLRGGFDLDVWALKEGEIFGANTPILRVTGQRWQAQLVETALCSIVNFQTLIASKASRIRNASPGCGLMEFGLRRGFGREAGLRASRAAYIAGFDATSNEEAGMVYGIPTAGTHAHSFVMSFEREIEAFRAYAKTYPQDPTFLIDTYDVRAGLENAIVVAKELEKLEGRLGAVRLDSGDLAADSVHARERLDRAGLGYVKIVASNDLDEYEIRDLVKNGARINSFGVGTRLVTGHPVGSLGMVYKLAEDESGGKMKLTGGKETLPGKKQVLRFDAGGFYYRDVLMLESEQIWGGQPLLAEVVRKGERLVGERALWKARAHYLESVAKLPDKYRAIECENPYPVAVSPKLMAYQESVRAKTQEVERI